MHQSRRSGASHTCVASLRRRCAAASLRFASPPLRRRFAAHARPKNNPPPSHSTNQPTQLGLALAIIGITAVRMANVDINRIKDAWQQLTGTCLLSAGGSVSLCYYVYALGAVSIVFTLSIGLMQCWSCGRCGCGAVMDTVFAVMASAWWLVGAFVVSSNAAAASSAGLPGKQWRDALVIMTWVMVGLFGALFAVHLFRVCAKFGKRCCGGRGRGGGGGAGGKGPVDTATSRAAALELGKEVRARPYMAGGAGSGGSSLQQQFGGPHNI